DSLYVAIHGMADEPLVEPALDATQVGAVAGVEGIRIVEDAEVIGDALLLDVGIFASPLDARRRQIRRGGTIAAKAACLWESTLQAGEVRCIEDEAFQRDPAPVQ